MDPDPTLSFELGETIYENSRVTEWVKFWKACVMCTFGAMPAFYVFEMYAGDGAPSLAWLADVSNWW